MVYMLMYMGRYMDGYISGRVFVGFFMEIILGLAVVRPTGLIQRYAQNPEYLSYIRWPFSSPLTFFTLTKA